MCAAPAMAHAATGALAAELWTRPAPAPTPASSSDVASRRRRRTGDLPFCAAPAELSETARGVEGAPPFDVPEKTPATDSTDLPPVDCDVRGLSGLFWDIKRHSQRSGRGRWRYRTRRRVRTLPPSKEASPTASAAASLATPCGVRAPIRPP